MHRELEIYVIDGPVQDTTHPLPVGQDVVIGRHDVDLMVDLDLQERVISSPHLKLRFDGERIFLQDLESRNGTKVGEQTLRGGDEVEVALGEVIHLAPPRGPQISTRWGSSGTADDPLRAEIQRLGEQIKQLRAENQSLRAASRPTAVPGPVPAIDTERVALCLDDFQVKFSRLIDKAPESLKTDLLSIQGRFRELERLLGIRRPP